MDLNKQMDELADRTFKGREQEAEQIQSKMMEHSELLEQHNKHQEEIKELFEKYRLNIRGEFLRTGNGKTNINMNNIMIISFCKYDPNEMYAERMTYNIVVELTNNYTKTICTDIPKEDAKKITEELIDIISAKINNPIGL